MVNPAFSESQLKNLRRQNRHLVSTHRRKLVFLQASRNPAHGSGRPFFVRDVPVPASFCPAPVPSPLRLPFPQLRPFCRPCLCCLRLPASPAHRTELGFVLCALPFRIPARHPGNGPARHLSARPLSLRPSPLRLPLPPLPSSDRSAVPSASALVFQPLPHAGQSSVPYCACCRSASPPESRERSRPASFCPAPVASAFAPPAPVSAAPQLRPFHRPRRSVPSSPSRSRTPDKVRVCTVHAAVPHPRPAPRERSRPTSFCPAFAPTAPGPCRSPAPTVPPSSPLRTFVSQPHPHAGQSSDSFYAHYRSASPPGTPGTVPPDIFLPGLRPSGSRFRRFPAPTVPPSSPLRTFVSQPLPHAGQSSVPFCTRCRSASPPESRERSRPASFCPAPVAPPPPRGDRQNRLLLRPGTRKGLSDRSQTAPFLSVLLFGNFSQYAIFRKLEKLVRRPPSFVQPFENFPPPPNMPLKGSKNLPDSSVRSRIAQPADRLPAPAATGLSSSSHRSSGSPDR